MSNHIEEAPTETNINLVKTILAAKIAEDEGFADQLRTFLLHLQESNEVHQSVIKNVTSDSLTTKHVEQKAENIDSVKQEIVSKAKIKNISIDEIIQSCSHDS